MARESNCKNPDAILDVASDPDVAGDVDTMIEAYASAYEISKTVAKEKMVAGFFYREAALLRHKEKTRQAKRYLAGEIKSRPTFAAHDPAFPTLVAKSEKAPAPTKKSKRKPAKKARKASKKDPAPVAVSAVTA